MKSRNRNVIAATVMTLLILSMASHPACAQFKNGESRAKALGILAKTDGIDARVIARFGRDVKPRAVAQLRKNQDELSELVTRRRQLIGQRTAEKNRTDTITSSIYC